MVAREVKEVSPPRDQEVVEAANHAPARKFQSFLATAIAHAVQFPALQAHQVLKVLRVLKVQQVHPVHRVHQAPVVPLAALKAA